MRTNASGALGPALRPPAFPCGCTVRMDLGAVRLTRQQRGRAGRGAGAVAGGARMVSAPDWRPATSLPAFIPPRSGEDLKNAELRCDSSRRNHQSSVSRRLTCHVIQEVWGKAAWPHALTGCARRPGGDRPRAGGHRQDGPRGHGSNGSPKPNYLCLAKSMKGRSLDLGRAPLVRWELGAPWPQVRQRFRRTHIHSREGEYTRRAVARPW